jgi:hypothetical protein
MRAVISRRPLRARDWAERAGLGRLGAGPGGKGQNPPQPNQERPFSDPWAKKVEPCVDLQKSSKFGTEKTNHSRLLWGWHGFVGKSPGGFVNNPGRAFFCSTHALGPQTL